MITVGIFIKEQSDIIEYLNATRADNTFIKVDSSSITVDLDNIYRPNIYNRVELFADENISVNSSIQNINDISKTFTDFSQTFTVPASKQNNKIFRHWYENSNDNGFSALVKSDAYIELDTIPFRTGKIQLESCNIKNGKPQDYSITFIGALGSLKDKFAGLSLKDLDSTFYDFAYDATYVKNKVTTTTTSGNIMFPLISSDRYWNYGRTGLNDISLITSPIYYNELFPALKLQSVFDMIERDSKWNINFNGSFLTDAKFTSAYLYLKNAETFKTSGQLKKIDYQSQTGGTTQGMTFNLTTDVLNFTYIDSVNDAVNRKITLNITNTVASIGYSIYCFQDGVQISKVDSISTVGTQNLLLFTKNGTATDSSNYEFYFSSESPLTFTSTGTLYTQYRNTSGQLITDTSTINQTTAIITTSTISVNKYMPDIKIEDFFSGILKMFNLTCYTTDGINYNIEQIENYYTSGAIRNITKYIKSDNINLNRTKTYKKINFQYEKSESLINVGFKSANNVEYGSLLFDTGNDGEEYSIKLPFEDLNFSNLKDKFQVGYALKSDLQKYTPKPVILYDYNPTSLTSLASTTYYFSTSTSGLGTAYTSYKAFGQEYFDGTDTFSLNFNEQQSTLTNTLISNSLYNQYYQAYLASIFDSKARLIKVNAILPISLLTSLKLNDRLIIRDKRYLINTMQTNLITGEVQFELLTDNRIL